MSSWPSRNLAAWPIFPVTRSASISPMQHDEGHADELLARALLDAEDSAAVALKVDNLPLADALTVIFHGRRDLGTIQTYVAHGGLGAGSAVRANALLRVPVDLDLGHASDRDEAEELYASQARA